MVVCNVMQHVYKFKDAEDAKDQRKNQKTKERQYNYIKRKKRNNT